MPEPLRRVVEWGAGAAGEADWSAVIAVAVLAAAVGTLAFVAAVATAYWIRHVDVSDGGLPAAVATRGLRGFRRARGGEERSRWICGRCRSWNAAGADACYRGCGRRDDVRLVTPQEVGAAMTARPVPAPADPADEDAATADGPPPG